MSMSGVLTLTVAYAIPALLALGVLIRSPWPLPLRLSAPALALVLYVATFLSVPQLLGWPTRQHPPAGFRFVAAQIQQPDKARRDSGAIYLWLTDAAELSASPPPRAYRFPYSGPLHETVTSAMAKLQNGTPQLGEFTRPESPDFGTIEPAAPSSAADLPIRFYDMSDPLFPDK